MADNYLESRREELEKMRREGGEVQRLRWRKQLKAEAQRQAEARRRSASQQSPDSDL